MNAAKVDVLAVLDRSAHQHWEHGDNADAEDAESARAAVAELIVVATALLSYRHGEYPREGYLRDNDASRAQIDALATAIANVGGAT